MTDEWNVLLPRQIGPSGPESITDFAQCTSMADYDSDEAALDDIGRYDAIIFRLADLDAEVIDRADNLKVIAKHGAGLDSVDIEAASRRNIVVCNTPGANSRSVAEHAITLLFAVRRNVRIADRHVRDGNWDRSAYTGQELTGGTLGLFGFGSIARETSDLAHGIGQDVLMYDPYVPDDDVPARVERISEFDELFARSDAVTVHAPLTSETHHAISTAELDALGENGVLINTARGAIVDEAALLDALESDTLGGAGLDTFEEEPPGPENPLYDRDDVILTPHVGGVTREALERMSQRAAANVRTVYEGAVPKSTVNREEITIAE